MHQQGTAIRITIDGVREPGTRGWLCPQEPAVFLSGGPAGAARLIGAGCIEVGPAVLLATGQWQATFDTRALPADRVAAFAVNGRYRMILVHGDDASGGSIDFEVPPMNLTASPNP